MLNNSIWMKHSLKLYKIGFINRYKKTYEVHVSLNIEKRAEIEEFLEN